MTTAIANVNLPEASFQAQWYFTLLGAAMALVVGAAIFLAAKAVRPMWRRGETGSALAIVGACAACAIFFGLLAGIGLGLLITTKGG